MNGGTSAKSQGYWAIQKQADARFVLPTEPGTSIVKTDIAEQDIKAVLEKIFS